MVFTNTGRQFVAFLLGSDLDPISNIGIGTGSQAVLVTDSTLVTETLRNPITGSPDFSENFKVSFQADFNSVQVSGTAPITEFGLTDTASGTGFTGSMWQREGFPGVTFDGTNELQIVSVLQVLESGT